MANRSVIEINGRMYNVHSGSLVGSSPKQSTTSIDGIITPTQPVAQPASTHHPGSSFTHIEPARHHLHTKAAPAKAHQPQHAKTLMRSSVRRPKPNESKIKRIHAPAGALPVHQPGVYSSTQAVVNEKRVARAHDIPHSLSVERFAATRDSKFLPTIPEPRQAAAQPVPTPIRHSKLKVSPVESLLSAGLAQADSHTQAPPRFKRHRLRRVFGGLAIVVLLLVIGVGVFGYVNMANIDVSLASARAGLHAQIPSYLPPGFSFSAPVRYQHNLIVINFKNGQHNFSLIQQVSSWGSSDLISNFVDNTTGSYDTNRAGGVTVYTWGKGNATWVKNGIWYRISGNADLTTDNLLHIANSM